MFFVFLAASALSAPADSLERFVEAAPAPLIDASFVGPVEPIGPAPEDAKAVPQLSYTYIEGGFMVLSLDDTSVTNDDVDTYYLHGSFALGMFHLLAGYDYQSLDFMDTTAGVISLGAGIHFDVSPKFTVHGDALWLYNDVSTDVPGADDQTDGWMGRAGVRWMPIGWDGGGLELDGNVLYLDVENRLASDDSATGFDVGARVHFLRLFSIGAMYQLLGDDDQFGGNVRVSF